MLVHAILKMTPGLWTRVAHAASRHGLSIDRYVSEVLEVHASTLPHVEAPVPPIVWPRVCRCCHRTRKILAGRVRRLLVALRRARAERPPRETKPARGYETR